MPFGARSFPPTRPLRRAPASAASAGVLVLIASLLLTACATQSQHFSGAPNEYGPRREKQIFFALTAVSATDPQRNAILAAFDATDPQLKDLEAQSSAVLNQLRMLDPAAPGYLDSVQPLARQEGDFDAQKIAIQAHFLQVVAATLSPKQWKDWNGIFRAFEEPVSPGDYDSQGQGQGGGRRGRGGGF